MKSSHCPKYERKNLKNSALSIQGKIWKFFCSYFGQCDDFILSFWNLLTFTYLVLTVGLTFLVIDIECWAWWIMSGGLYCILLPALDAQNSQILFRLMTCKCTWSKRSKGKTENLRFESLKITDTAVLLETSVDATADQLLLTETDFSRSQLVQP